MGLFSKKLDEESNQEQAIIQELRRTIEASGMPEYAMEVAKNELNLLSKINSGTAEYTIGLTYIEYLTSLPWNKKTEDILDLRRAENILNERHYGLEKIKERIIGHLAVKILKTEARPRILVVDDEEIARINMEKILTKEGYTVACVSSGVEALQLLENSYFDIVLTDMKMQNVDGTGVLEKAKSRYPDTKVIIITGYGSIENAVETMKKGAFNYIQKPFRVEHLRAVVKEALQNRMTANATKGSILCFAGPPGTGKTSLGRSIADALGRRFSRISLGGIRDEAEIRGHRRTYAGARPGRIIEEIRRTGVLNPVIMLDEIDKIGRDFKGDSSSALLEVLDPEQNKEFIDHYLDIPFDLSNVMFICTANVAENIEDALRDRLEIIQFSGYTEDEKIEISQKHLIPKQIHDKGLQDFKIEFSDSAILKIIHEYTREAGIRDLERQIATICRKIATEIVRGDKKDKTISVTPESVEAFLGPRRYYFEIAEEKDRVGVTTGLVWTEAGGSIIFVETVCMKGSGELILTGSLGEIMRESAQTALSYVKSNASKFGIDENIFSELDIHVHVPAGAIPKDGPSAGATIAMAIISLLTSKPARKDIAVTGEITLTGRLLPVGGIREKMLAARHAGIKSVVLPSKNKVDVDTLPHSIKRDIDIHLVEELDQIVDMIFSQSTH